MNLLKPKYIVLSLTLLVGSSINGWAAEQTAQQEDHQGTMFTHLQAMGIAEPSSPQIDEGLRLQAVYGFHPKPHEIHESMRLQSMGIAAPGLPEIHESMRLQSMGIVAPSALQINEALRLGVLHGSPATAEQIAASLAQR